MVAGEVILVENSELLNHHVRIWLSRPEGFKYDGRLLDMDEDWVIIRDARTNKPFIFIRENIERIEVLG